MKHLWILCLILAGCQSAPAPVAPANPSAAGQPPQPEPNRREADLEARLQQQRYIVDALLSQQEALRAQLSGTDAKVAAKPFAGPRPVPVAPATVEARPSHFLQPDGKGVIDLAALAVKPADSANTNPFVVQAAESTPVREVAVLVQGILSGTTPSAIVNERPLEIGESVESLRLVRVEPDAAYFAAGNQLLQIPLGRPVRVRLP